MTARLSEIDRSLLKQSREHERAKEAARAEYQKQASRNLAATESEHTSSGAAASERPKHLTR